MTKKRKNIPIKQIGGSDSFNGSSHKIVKGKKLKNHSGSFERSEQMFGKDINISKISADTGDTA